MPGTLAVLGAAGAVEFVAVKITNLQRLDLRRTKVTDAGLADLKNPTSVRSPYLGKVTDAGLAHIKNQISLQSLRLKNLISLQSEW